MLWRPVPFARRSRELIPPVAIIAMGLFLRAWGLEARGLWFDEMLSLQNALGSVRTEPLRLAPNGFFTQDDFWAGNTLSNVVLAVVWHDSGNALLYNVALHFWLRLFGTSDAAVRSLSVLSGTGVAWLTYLVATRFLPRRAGLWALAIVALHPLFIRASGEARAYAMATMLTLAATLLLLELTRPVSDDSQSKRNASKALAYGALCGASLMTHYLTAGILAFHFVFAFARVRRARSWLYLLLAWLGAATIVLTWLAGSGGTGLELMRQRDQGYAHTASTSTAPNEYARPATPVNLAAGLVQISAAASGNWLAMAGVLRLREALPLLAIPVVVLAFGLRALRQVPDAVPLLMLLASSWPLLAVALAIRSGHVIPFHVSYVNFATPYLCILLGAGLDALSKRRGMLGRPVVLVYAAIVVSSLAVGRVGASSEQGPNTHRQSALMLAAVAQPGDTVVYPSWVEARLHNCYLPRSPRINQQVTERSAGVRLVRDGEPVINLDIEPLARDEAGRKP